LSLAIFDLDNTLLRGDSDYEWGQFLIAEGAVDAEVVAREHDRYYAQYLEGTLDIFEFLAFQLRPLAEHDRATLERWREKFMQTRIQPLITDTSKALVDSHRRSGDTLLIITATNGFITRPIADAFGVAHLIATEPEEVDGRFTGKVAGTPSYREGKITRLEPWLDQHGETLAGSWFYSDSHNDLPLLKLVDNPVAVNPDPTLADFAREHQWRILQLT
jgi:HAD superfamily hydrolase (TIGR01490 family)